MPIIEGARRYIINQSKKAYETKPLTPYAITFEQKSLTLSEIIESAKQGHAFCYNYCHEGNELRQQDKTQDNYTYTDILFFDFDHYSESPEMFCDSLPFRPSGYYTSYSNLRDGRYSFRLLYALNQPIIGKDRFNAIRDAIAERNGFSSWKDENGKLCGYDKRSCNQQYYGTNATAETMCTNLVYSVDDFGVDLSSIATSSSTTECKRTTRNQENKPNKKIDKDFLKDFMSMPSRDFLNKYRAFERIYRNSLHTTLIPHHTGAMYLYPKDYVEVPRKWENNKICRYGIGEDRKAKLYVTAQIIRKNTPEISIEEMIYCLFVYCHRKLNSFATEK